MKAAVQKFESATTRNRAFEWRNQHFAYIGTITALRQDGLTRVLGMYVAYPNGLTTWNPDMGWVDTSLTDYIVTMTCIAEGIETTNDQWALHWIRDYVKDNWWWLFQSGLLDK